MTKLNSFTAWSICKKVLAMGLEVLHHLIQASGPTTKPGAAQIYGRYDDGEIGPLQCNQELRKLKIK